MTILAEEREVDADGKVTAGVFIPVPYDLARQFPRKDEHDDSVPHFTVLYVGDITPEQQENLVSAVYAVAQRWQPFWMRMNQYGEFTNPEGQTIAHMIGDARVRYRSPAGVVTRGLEALHAELFMAAEIAGVPVAHRYGVESDVPLDARPILFKSHATLAYLEPGETYSGPMPKGTWLVDELEVWGHEKIRVPLGRIVVDQPHGGLDESWAPVSTPTPPDDEDAPEKDKKEPPDEPDDIPDDEEPGEDATDVDAVEDDLAPAFALMEAFPQPPKAQRQKLYRAMRKKAEKLSGKKIPKKPVKTSWLPKGLTVDFEGGGVFKIRPKSGGVFLAKFYGLPTPTSRFLGAGNSVAAAIDSMQDEVVFKSKQAGGHIAPPKPPAPGPVATPEPKGKKQTKKKPKGKQVWPKPDAYLQGDPGPDVANVNGVRLHNTLGVNRATFDKYATALHLAVEDYKRHGFGFMFGRFGMYLKVGKGGALADYYGARYKEVNPDINIYVNVIESGGYGAMQDIKLIMIHEMAHHFYYKVLPRSLRKKYKAIYAHAKEYPSTYAMPPQKVFGGGGRYEDFPEIFAAFIGKGHKIPGLKKPYKLTADMMNRVKALLAMDPRVDAMKIKLHDWMSFDWLAGLTEAWTSSPAVDVRRRRLLLRGE